MFFGVLISVGLSVLGAAAAPMDDAGAVRELFSNPPREFCTAPLWVWNDMLTEEQITHSLEELAKENVRQVFVHPRPGLMTPYMDNDWFRLWKHTLKEAERLDMNAWIYDENSYPSGFAGGLVSEAMPGANVKGVDIVPFKPDMDPAKILACYQKDGDAYKLVKVNPQPGDSALAQADLVAEKTEVSSNNPWFAGWFYVDLQDRSVTEKFIELTMERYRKEFGGAFPDRMPGVFTDEPHLGMARNFHWTPGVEQKFKDRWGYDIVEHLPSLALEVGDYKKVRHNYHQLMLDLFIENWAKPYYEYCARHNIEFTGHYWEHEWPRPKYGPDNMAMSAWQQRPGIDMLFNEPYQYGSHAQVGNTRAIMEVASVANQLGHPRTLCEAYGGSGWDMRFEDMKRIGDWLCVLGINTMDQHLAHMTLRGARKRDYPPTFTYHEPWWNSYDVSATYFARLCLAISQGQQINKILVIEPTTTAWLYSRETGDEIGNQFQSLVADLLAAQVEFDLGSEDVIARNGSVNGKGLVVGKRTYSTVVLPPRMENVNSPVLALLEAFAKAGGNIIACQVPELVDGAPSAQPAQLADAPGFAKMDADQLPTALQPTAADGFAIRRAENSALLFHQRRVFNNGELLFLVNTSTNLTASGMIESAARGIEMWDLETGKVHGYPSKPFGTGVTALFNLPPAGSLLLFLSNEAVALEPKPEPKGRQVAPSGELAVNLTGPNVLTLDYVDIEAGGETKQGVPFKVAAQLAFQKNGFDRNPWDSAVQFRDEFIKKTFPPESGFAVTYRFNIDGEVPKPLYFVAERTDLYQIECNGKPLNNQSGEWWLDKAFGKLDISEMAVAGENAITLKASPFSVFHEVEAAFVVGQFSLKPIDKGFAIAAARPLGLGAWNDQGCPLYGHGVSYTQTFNVADPQGSYFVSLPDWYGSVANVTVNGKPAGYIYRQPFSCDVTPLIQAGANTIEVTVFGTLRNTLGPHHGNKKLGFASPGSWNEAPEAQPAGAAYGSIRYGLFKPFELLR